MSLVEILVSMIIFGLVMASLANIFVSAKRWIMHSRSRMAAGELGKYFLDPLHTDVRQDQWGSNCLTTGSGCPGAQTINDITYTPVYTISDVGSTTLRRVRVKIDWTEPTP